MTEKDWIILRLLRGWVNTNYTRASTHPDYVRTIVYLRNKVGEKALFDAIDQLNLSR